MSPKSTRSLGQVAAELQADPEQSLVFERFLSADDIKQVCRELGHTFRDRVYSPVITIWMFLGQTLSPNHSCRDAVHRLNAWRTEHSKPKIHKEIHKEIHKGADPFSDRAIAEKRKKSS